MLAKSVDLNFNILGKINANYFYYQT